MIPADSPFDQAMATLFTVVNIVVAVGVTVHVLLRKRDVAPAIGWISLAWLVPLLGSLLYIAFGVNRVQRRARRLRRRRSTRAARARLKAQAAANEVGGFPALRVAARRITDRDAEPGNAVVMLRDGDEAYPAMLAAINGASQSVMLASFIFHVDKVGETFVVALAEAHRRGVAVRVLVDGIGGGYFISPAYRALRRAGVPVARFLWSVIPWRMPLLNMRSHRKILVVDGEVAFTGGMNIGAENLRRQPKLDRVRDVHFQVRGPVVTQIAETFAEDWRFTVDENIDHLVAPPGPPVGEVTARIITSGPDQDLARLEMVLLSAINTAEHSIHVVTPYFLPNEGLLMALELAALRGVAVDIVIPRRCDHRFMSWAMAAHIAPLLEAGCRVWHAGEPFNHAKLMTIDGKWALVGSANWDARSLRLNFELDLEVYDEALAKAIRETAVKMGEVEVTLQEILARPLPVVLRDAVFRLMLPYL